MVYVKEENIMNKETQLCIIIAALMKELGVDKYVIAQETIDELTSDDTYIGVNTYKEGNKMVVQRTKKENVTGKDLIEAFLKSILDD